MACAPILAPVALADSNRPTSRRPGEARNEPGVPARGARCGGCSTSYDGIGWRALPLVTTMTGEAIANHVVKWPPGVAIEIRRCSRCGRSIARKTVEFGVEFGPEPGDDLGDR
jgi:hypothetical protein